MPRLGKDDLVSSSTYQPIYILLATVIPPSMWGEKGTAQLISRTISGNSVWAEKAKALIWGEEIEEL